MLLRFTKWQRIQLVLPSLCDLYWSLPWPSAKLSSAFLFTAAQGRRGYFQNPSPLLACSTISSYRGTFSNDSLERCVEEFLHLICLKMPFLLPSKFTMIFAGYRLLVESYSLHNLKHCFIIFKHLMFALKSLGAHLFVNCH